VDDASGVHRWLRVLSGELAERLVEEERVRILQMQEAAKQNRARTVGEARRLVSEQYSLANNAKAFKASAKEASPSWLLWE